MAATENQSIINPVAQRLCDLIMPLELQELRAVADEIGIDIQTECNALYGCNVESLSHRYAPDLLAHLRSLSRMADVA